jgi:trehalose 6-phosphate phosphatase
LTDNASLFIDFDGTLVELADRPDAVHVDDALGPLLQKLRTRLSGRIAIVSGRSIAQIDGFLGPSLDGIAVVGSHGAEIRFAGDAIVRPERPATMAEAEAAFTGRFGGNPGVVIEVKSLGVAIHYRLAPEVEAEAEALVAAFADRHGLAVQRGKMMTELRIAGHDKGTAVMALAQAAPFAGHPPVFAGDDLTDETAFVACAHAGGGGILIGAPRETAALWRIGDVAGFRNWLETAA